MSDDPAAPPDLQDVLDENQTSIFHLSLLNKKKEGKDLFGGKKSMCIQKTRNQYRKNVTEHEFKNEPIQASNNTPNEQ